ncbi:Fic family protein [Bathymodiolus thermophilus thioautotrophic gill symbiont]|uniref:Cell filamentation protein Fic n=1 Tax=Bathymodiolus thermophilus thioautotrophic gill symbiont TaxID=2360 RepID=A0A1J5TZD4_9GAMM|nr:Fic family protein [Bathymodiolus thermophilus thioautotrophic gill symbiont]OIR25588.1 cell filamentation protein Fic [Bathymodiolus thermophilus thioautotrophic gill symbiont]
MFDFQTIDALQAKFNRLNHSQGVADKLHEDLIIRWTYHSNAIEGNTLTLQETKVVLEGVTVAGKSIVEHLEAVNHKEAILFVEQLSCENSPLSELDIKSLHHLILTKIDEKNAGKYRTENVIISGAEHHPPSFLEVPQKMSDFISWCATNFNKIHPVIMAARIHTDFVGIHPFVDGNGRTARLLMNLSLIKNKLPPIIIQNEHKLEYYQALDTAHTKGDYQPFVQLVMQQLETTLSQAIED